MSFEIDSFENVPDNVNDLQLIARHRQKRKELDELVKAKKENPKEDKAAYRYAHYFCHPNPQICGAIIPRWIDGIDNSGAWQQHQQTCEYQIALRKESKDELQARRDGTRKSAMSWE